VFFEDLQRAITLLLRLMFYATPIVYDTSKFDKHPLVKKVLEFNPLDGPMGIYRSMFFKDTLNWHAVIISAIESLIILVIGIFAFRRNVRAVLKEL
jgi:ABC-2 type transport system permease protein